MIAFQPNITSDFWGVLKVICGTTGVWLVIVGLAEIKLVHTNSVLHTVKTKKHLLSSTIQMTFHMKQVQLCGNAMYPF